MSTCRRVPWLRCALLSRTLPPAGGAASLSPCRLLVQSSDCPGVGSKDDVQGAQEEASGAPGSGMGRLLRRAWGKSLSPLDRVSRMIPPEFISREVQNLQSSELPNVQGEGSPDWVTPLSPGSPTQDIEKVTPLSPGSPEQDVLKATPLSPGSPAQDVEKVTPLSPGSPAQDVEKVTPLSPGSPAQDVLKATPLSPGSPAQDVLKATPLSPGSPAQDVLKVAPLSPGSPAQAILKVAPLSPGSPAQDVVKVTPQQASPSSPKTLHSGCGNVEPPQSKENAENTSGLQPPTSPLPPASVIAPGADDVPSPPLGTPFTYGDLLLAEYKRKHFSMFKKMFLLKPHGKLVSNWGAISNRDIVGKYPGQKLPSSIGHQLLLRRPSLAEYVTFMKRGPNIGYPKDIQAMLMAMDVSPGDVVLEAGSGSGALSLFLSRAVGSDGLVYSFEVRKDHHEVAKKNFSTWKKAWEIRSGRTWPENVRFINKSIRDALPDIKSVALDAVALDMLNPQVALPVITGSLKHGAVCAVYITNITQVIDLLEGIRCCKLPLLCEQIIEVYVTNWLVAPSLRKDGRISKRVKPQDKDDEEEEDKDNEEIDEDDNGPAISEEFGEVPYIARPLPWQTGHTAFLVHLRKFIPAPPTQQEDST